MANEWTSQASDTGQFVQHTGGIMSVYAKEIKIQATAALVYTDWLVERSDFSKTPGDKIYFRALTPLSLEGALTETSDLDSDPIVSPSDVSITVAEYGKAVGITKKYDIVGFLNDDANLALLANNYGRQMHVAARDAMAACTNIKYAGGAASLAAIPGSIAGHFSVSLVMDGVELLESYDAVPFKIGNEEFFICFIHSHQKNSIMKDPAWIDAANYGDPIRRFNGVVGKVHNVVFIMTNLARNGAVGATHDGYAAAYNETCTAAGVDGYEAILLAEGAGGYAKASEVAIATETENFGRRVGVAWLQYCGYGIIDDNHLCKLASI